MSNAIISISGPTAGSVTVTISAATRDAVVAAIDRYLIDWHPMGYGTRFAAPAEADGVWRAIGSRSTSCG